jgi:sugar porter (SP) family MFS transporter
LPESPRWLVKAGQSGQARKILLRIGSEFFADSTIPEIEGSLKEREKVNYKSLFRRPIRPILITGIILAVFQQFCGINVVLNYTPRIFASIGASMDNQLLQTVFIGLVNLIFTFVAMGLVDKIGRKPLMLIGSGGLSVIFFLIARLLTSESFIVSALLLLSIGTFAMSLAPVTWVLISEIFPNKVRGTASSIAVMSLWAAYFILIFTFPPLFENLGDKTFYIYAFVCVLGFVFILFRLRETRNKTLEQLENYMSKNKSAP